MKFLRRILAILAFVTLLSGGTAALGAEKVCADCHGDDAAVLPIGKTKHGTTADPRTPACMSCHGDSVAHKKKPSRNKPERTFDKKSLTPVAERNAACLGCHDQDGARSHWSGSTHEARGLACSACHSIHGQPDRVRDKRTQSEVCFSCHKEQRSQSQKPSHHPLLEGKMACSDCHNVHGSVGPKLLVRDSVVETCYTCHMEKRGPFVFSHEPVNDDCTTCHNPHGTSAQALLKMRPPYLCQSCHTPHAATQPLLAGQPGVNAPAITSWASGSSILQGRSCLNCHTQVHGSNSPSLGGANAQFLFR